MMYNHVCGRVPRRTAIAAIGVTLLVALILVNLPTGGLGGSPAPGNASLQSFNKPATPPGALHIPLAGPVVNLQKGDIINLTYEYEAVSYNSSLYSLSLRMPTIFGVFTQKDGALLYVPLLNRNVTISHSQLTHYWFNNGVTTHVSDNITGNYTLNPKIQPFLSSVKLAIMANTTWGNLRLGIRWDYSIWIASNDTTLSSAWTVPGHDRLPYTQSVVTPAELVTIASTTPTNTTVGSWFRATLTGLVSPAHYWIEVESPFTGHGVNHVWDNTSSVGLTSYTVGIVLARFHGTMTPTPWLVHIHDSHGDILYSLPVYLTDPTKASVFFKDSPSACGPIEFNGRSYASGTADQYLPVNQTYNLTAASCAGYSFSGWSQFGDGLEIANPGSASTTADLLYNDTVTAKYVPLNPS
jgi:hypothetical protein